MVLCSVWIDGILCKVTKHLLNNKILTHKIYFINISYPPFCSLHGIRCKLYAKSHALSVLFWLVVLLCFNASKQMPQNMAIYSFLSGAILSYATKVDMHTLYILQKPCLLSMRFTLATQFLSSFYSAFLAAYFILCASSAL